MKPRPEDCEHSNIEYLAVGYCECLDCGILMPDEIPVEQLDAWGVKHNKTKEEDDATGE